MSKDERRADETYGTAAKHHNKGFLPDALFFMGLAFVVPEETIEFTSPCNTVWLSLSWTFRTRWGPRKCCEPQLPDRGHRNAISQGRQIPMMPAELLGVMGFVHFSPVPKHPNHK